VKSGSEAKILTQILYKILPAGKTEILQIHVTGAVLISAWGNSTKKINSQALVPFEIRGGYFEHISIIAPGMIAYCILGVNFVDEFQDIISFKDQCMYINDENGSRRQQFVSEEMGKVELKEGAPIGGIRNCIIDGGERRSSCNNEKKNERSLVVLASDIAYDNH